MKKEMTAPLLDRLDRLYGAQERTNGHLARIIDLLKTLEKKTWENRGSGRGLMMGADKAEGTCPGCAARDNRRSASPVIPDCEEPEKKT